MIVIASSGGRASFPHGWHCPEVASTKKVIVIPGCTSLVDEEHKG